MFVVEPAASSEELKLRFAAWLAEIDLARETGADLEVLGFIHARPRRGAGRRRPSGGDPRLDS
jgi:hypothetical protein